MDQFRPRTSRPRRRSEPLIAKPLSQDSKYDTKTERIKDFLKSVRPKTACSQPKSSSSRNSSGVRASEKYLYAHDSTETETDTETIKASSPKAIYNKHISTRESSRVGSIAGDEKYFSACDLTGTETDTETLKALSPKDFYSTSENLEGIINDVGDDDYSSDFDSDVDDDDGAETVISVPQNEEYSLPATPMTFCDALSFDSFREYTSTVDSDASTVISIASKQKKSRHSRRSSGVREEICLKDEKPIVPILNLDDLRSVSEISSVMLKSTRGVTDLKMKESKRRDASGSRLAEQLKKIDAKNMLFFPSRTLTRPSIESIYGPVKKRSSASLRSSSSLRQSSNTLASSKVPSNVSNNKAKAQKTPLEKDTPRPAAIKEEAVKPSDLPAKKNEPKILPPLMTKRMADKKVDRNRPSGPVKPKPFMASGCGKGIPSLENLPKPVIGRVPSFILNKRREAEEKKKEEEQKKKEEEERAKKAEEKRIAKENSFKSQSLNFIEKIKPAIPSAAQMNSKTTDDILPESKIPLKKRGSQSTSNLISTAEPDTGILVKRGATGGVLKPKKSVTFAVPEPANSPKTEEPKKSVNTTYIDPCRRQYKKFFEKLPVFDEGPLPVTEPTRLYQAIKNKGWEYSQFTPKNPKYPVATIPYNFLDQYLHIFNNNLERAAVHMKYGSVAICTCDQAGDAGDFCEKHVDIKKLQYYQEACEVMICVLSVRYEVPEYDEAEKLFEEKYPYIYSEWVLKFPTRLSLDYRVREAKCKVELVGYCKRVLEEEQLLAEFTQSEEIIGLKRDISISGRMKNLDDDFELSYTFLVKEYPNLFVQLVQKIEFMPLAIERKAIGTRRKQVAKRALIPDEKLQEMEDLLIAQSQEQEGESEEQDEELQEQDEEIEEQPEESEELEEEQDEEIEEQVE